MPPTAADNDAVRIFVEFARVDQAIKGRRRNLVRTAGCQQFQIFYSFVAYLILFFIILLAAVALNGRFFGGRHVRVSFYDPDKFANFELTI